MRFGSRCLRSLMARRSPMANWPIGWRVAAGSRKRGWKAMPQRRPLRVPLVRQWAEIPSRSSCPAIAWWVRTDRSPDTPVAWSANAPARARGGAVTEAFDNLAYACRQPPHVSTASARVYFRGGFSAYSCRECRESYLSRQPWFWHEVRDVHGGSRRSMQK